VKSYKGDLGKYGVCFISASYQNNMFNIGYGQCFASANSPETYYYHMTHVIHATFDNGVWSFYGWEPRNSDIRHEFQVPQKLQDLVVKAILDNDILRGKLEKWRIQELNRLLKSVPRLKKEYEEAEARLKALESVSF
jgi:hypothetical protein